MLPDAECATNAQDCRAELALGEKEAVMSNEKITILYERLSVDDDREGESNSITNQRRLLEDYAERNGLAPYIHLSDDGYSGTNWDRPGWQKVIDEIEAGRVSTIVVKNLDRMGRDYLRVGLYMEMFREKGIRLIAMSDGVDTSQGEDDFTPLRALFAEWFARDTSKKLKTVFAAKGKSGKPLANIPPYGYVKDPSDKNKWLVDPEAAVIVRRIFKMAIDGMGPRVIASKLYSEKVERPSYYLAKRGLGRYKNTCDNEHPYAWNYSSVAQILAKLEYCGHTVNFKGEKPSFKSKKYVARPKDEWVIFENTHEPIIPQETWELVQKLRQTKRRHDTLGEANPLTGLVFCADCGAKMHNYRRGTPNILRRGDKVYTSKLQNGYLCSTYKRTNAKYDPKCTAHCISTDALRQIILGAIQATTTYVRQHEQEFAARIREAAAVKKGETAKSYQRQIVKNKKRIAELERIYRSLYEDKALGKISGERFDEMTGSYDHEREAITAQTRKLRAELEAFEADSVKVGQFLKLVQKYTRIEELTPAIINEFVDKIFVYANRWSEGINPETGRGRGTCTQKVEVFLKYIGKFEVPMDMPEETEAERIAAARKEQERTYKREYARRMRAKAKQQNSPSQTA